VSAGSSATWGPHAARGYQFVGRGIAGALVAVGAGATYRQAALVARGRARRLRVDPDTGELRESRHGQLVADWVELFAPVVFEPHRPEAWPAAGSLVIDDLPFRVRNTSRPGRAPVAFRVFCALGYVAGRPRMWWMEAFTDASARSWEAFRRSLPGAPGRVVCELHYGQRTALERLWPETEVYLCEWHLQHALERLMNTERRRNPQHAQAIDALVPCIERAFDGRYFWRPFVRESAAGIDALDLWLEEMDPPIEDQFARRGPASGRPADMPLSTGGPGAARSPHQGLAPPAPLRAQEPRAAQPASAANAAPPQRLERPNRLRHPHSRPAHRQQRPPTRGAPRHRRPSRRPSLR
jgi:hypothetical protein